MGADLSIDTTDDVEAFRAKGLDAIAFANSTTSGMPPAGIEPAHAVCSLNPEFIRIRCELIFHTLTVWKINAR